MLLLFIFTDLRHVLTFNFILIFWTLATTSDSIFWSLNGKLILQNNNSITLYSLTRGTHFHMPSTVLIIKYFMIDFIIKFLWKWFLKNITANLTLEINIGLSYNDPCFIFFTINLLCLENTNMLDSLFL